MGDLFNSIRQRDLVHSGMLLVTLTWRSHIKGIMGGLLTQQMVPSAYCEEWGSQSSNCKGLNFTKSVCTWEGASPRLPSASPERPAACLQPPATLSIESCWAWLRFQPSWLWVAHRYWFKLISLRWLVIQDKGNFVMFCINLQYTITLVGHVQPQTTKDSYDYSPTQNCNLL